MLYADKYNCLFQAHLEICILITKFWFTMCIPQQFFVIQHCHPPLSQKLFNMAFKPKLQVGPKTRGMTLCYYNNYYHVTDLRTKLH